AIDGVGADTQDYIDLLVGCGAQLPMAAKLRLLTSDPNAARQAPSGVECRQIEPLDYFAYSKFCVEGLADHVDTTHCLMVQLDGFVLNKQRWTPEFAEYDYIGAPWLSTQRRPLPTGCTVGSGGFSLRSARFLAQSAQLEWHRDWQDYDVPEKYWGNEDYFLAVICRQQLEAAGLRFAPESLARRFSIQAGDRLGPDHWLPNVFGFHGRGLMRRVHRYLKAQDLDYPHLERNLPRRRYFILPW
ncbi:MAG: DUF5672 family protein, partial [Planctomycetota bacterium]